MCSLSTLLCGCSRPAPPARDRFKAKLMLSPDTVSRGQSTLYDPFLDNVVCETPHLSVEKGNVMKLQRTKYKRTTPKSHTEYSSTSISLGGSFKHLFNTVARLIEKYFGLLYVSIYKVGT